MIVYDDKKLAINPKIYSAIARIPNAQQIDILDRMEIGLGVAFTAYLNSLLFTGVCLIAVVHRDELDTFTKIFPKSSQMQSLERHIPILEYAYAQNTQNEDLVALVLKIPKLEKDKSTKLSELFSRELIPFKEILLRIEALIDLLENWNSYKDLARRVRYFTPLDAIKHCLINTDQIPNRVLDIDNSTPIITLDGWKSLPNPLAYIEHLDLWEGYDTMPMPLGRINGALSTESLLVRVDIGSNDFVMLDWSKWKEDGFCPLIDFATLELDVLMRVMPLIDNDIRGEWSCLLDHIFENVCPPPPTQGIHTTLAWTLIAPIRKSVNRIIEGGISQGIDFTRSFWIAVISSGLRVLLDTKLSIDQRIIGMMYASYGFNNILVKSRKPGKSILLNLKEISGEFVRNKYLPFDKGIALLIGVGDYDLPLRPIPAAAQDALSLNNTLKDVGYSERNVNCLLNSEASLKSLRNSMHMISSNNIRHLDDTMILFFSGHGAYLNGEYYFLTHGANLENLKETALSVKELSEWLASLKANSRLIIFDCCYSGEVLHEAVVNLPDNKLEQIAGGGSIVMVSSDSHQKSYILPGNSNSIFTACLVEALSGNAYNPLLKTISAFDVFNYVSENVRQRAAKSGWRQTPRLGANINRCFPIVYPSVSNKIRPELNTSNT